MNPLSARGERDRSFERLYERHRAEVYRSVLRDVGNREDAEDLTQVAFLNAYRAYVAGTLPERPRPWLFAIAENASRRRFRVQSRRPQPTELPDEVADPAADAPTAGELHEALAQLPANQRAALVLREVGGLSYAEIADRLELSVASVQMLLFRARRSLRAELEPRAARRGLGSLASWPLPGWLQNLLASPAGPLERLGLLPRAAGVVGAAVLGVAFASGTGALPVPGRAADEEATSSPARAAAAATAPARAAAGKMRRPAASGQRGPVAARPARRVTTTATAGARTARSQVVGGVARTPAPPAAQSPRGADRPSPAAPESPAAPPPASAPVPAPELGPPADVPPPPLALPPPTLPLPPPTLPLPPPTLPLPPPPLALPPPPPPSLPQLPVPPPPPLPPVAIPPVPPPVAIPPAPPPPAIPPPPALPPPPPLP